MTVRRHEDRIAFVLVRGVDDAFVRVHALLDDAVARHARRLGGIAYFVDRLLRDLFRAPLEFGHQTPVGEIAFAVDVCRRRSESVVGGNRCAHLLGEGDARRDRLGGDLRAVGGNQDVLEHGGFLLLSGRPEPESWNA
jgi:hypothetical protein